MKAKPKIKMIQVPSFNGITSIIKHPKQQNKILATGGAGQLFLISLKSFKILQETKVMKQTAMCLMSFREGFLLGGSLGELLYMNLNYETLIYRKLHTDCLSSIMECDQFIITSGYDGMVFFLNKQSLEVQHYLQFSVPFWKSHCHDNKLYLAGNPSYCVSTYSDFTVTELKRYDHFQSFHRRLYGCSDQRGLTCLSTNSNSYIPCNFILKLENSFLTFSEECIGAVRHQTQMEWKCQRVKEIKKGTTIRAGLASGKFIILGDDEGTLYRVSYHQEQFDKKTSKKPSKV